MASGIGSGVGLSERDRAILALERSAGQLSVSKARVVRERLGLSPTRYHQLLNRLIDRPEALATDPMLVHRLRRLREAKRRSRTARGLTEEMYGGRYGG